MYMPYGALLIEILNTHVYLICDLNVIGIAMTTTLLVLLVCSLKVERKTNDDILLCESTILVFIINCIKAQSQNNCVGLQDITKMNKLFVFTKMSGNDYAQV